MCTLTPHSVGDTVSKALSITLLGRPHAGVYTVAARKTSGRRTYTTITLSHSVGLDQNMIGTRAQRNRDTIRT